MPNAAELFVEVASKIAPPEFCAWFLSTIGRTNSNIYKRLFEDAKKESVFVLLAAINIGKGYAATLEYGLSLIHDHTPEQIRYRAKFLLSLPSEYRLKLKYRICPSAQRYLEEIMSIGPYIKDDYDIEKSLHNLIDNMSLLTRHCLNYNMNHAIQFLRNIISSKMQTSHAIETLLEAFKYDDHEFQEDLARIIARHSHKSFNTVKDVLLNAYNKSKINREILIKVVKYMPIHNPEAYVKYHLENEKVYSYISFLTSDDIGKVSKCCKSSIKIGDEAIAILDENKEKMSIHSLSCSEVNAAYWS